MASSDENSSDLQKSFDAIFSKIADNSDGKLSGEAAKKWLKTVDVVGDESYQISEEDAEKCLQNWTKQNGGGMDQKEFEQFIDDLAKEKEMDAKEIKKKLSGKSPEMEKAKQKLSDIKEKLEEEE